MCIYLYVSIYVPRHRIYLEVYIRTTNNGSPRQVTGWLVRAVEGGDLLFTSYSFLLWEFWTMCIYYSKKVNKIIINIKF